MAEEKETTAAKKPAVKKPATEASAAKPAAKAAAKPAEKATAKPAAKTAAKPAEKAAAKPAADKAVADKAPAEKKPAAKKAAAKPAAETTEEKKPQILKVHHLRPATGAKKDRTRVGRGEGSKGKTAGRGTKGTKARYQMKSFVEGGGVNYIMRTPKLRGFKNPFRTEYQVVNLAKIVELFPKGGDITVADLLAKGAVRKNELVKVLGDGDVSVKLNLSVDKVSSSAEQKIVAAGGTVTYL